MRRSIEVIGGDVETGEYVKPLLRRKFFCLKFFREHELNPDQFRSVEPLTEERRKSLAGAAGWGFIGLVALGPIGAIGGLILGGNRNNVFFAAELADGKKFVGKTNHETFAFMAACALKQRGKLDRTQLAS